MNPLDLYLSFNGRINRAKWWLGFVSLTILSIVVNIALNPAAFSGLGGDPTASNLNIDALKPTLLQLIVGLVFTVLLLAVIKKRLNDRNWGSWMFVLIALVYLAVQIGQYFVIGAATTLEEITISTLPFSALGLAVFVFLIIDNGMLKGTVGPNQYGEDPIAHKHVTTA
ncbi:MAG: DUF805 domain-containing protein [Pseudomonadota bacterium]